MQDPAFIEVWELEWDEDNELHCLEHDLTPELAEEVRESAPRFFENRPGRTGSHAMIGPDRAGRFWTIIILEAGARGRWRPITGWESAKAEVGLYYGDAKIR